MSNVQERRIYKRIEKEYTARLRVKQYKGTEISFAEWDMISLKNLGAGGAYFFYKKDLGIGTLLDLEIDAPKSKSAIKCVGEITRIDKPLPTSMFCIAIRFIDIGEQEKETIHTTVEETLG
jgi:hypothetical protein